jgi:hypothetical protein
MQFLCFSNIADKHFTSSRVPSSFYIFILSFLASLTYFPILSSCLFPFHSLSSFYASSIPSRTLLSHPLSPLFLFFSFLGGCYGCGNSATMTPLWQGESAVSEATIGFTACQGSCQKWGNTQTTLGKVLHELSQISLPPVVQY